MSSLIKARLLVPVVLVAALAGGVSACGGDDEETTGGPVTLRYGLWDSNQQPVYQQCADAFQKPNPNIKIDIQLNNWNDYWGGLARGFIAETAPDVFTDHLAKYPQFATSEVIEPLNRYAERDGLDAGQYQPGLADLWETPEGTRYGFPKDWDTVAVVSNQTMRQGRRDHQRAARHRDLEPAGRRHASRRSPRASASTSRASAATSRASTRSTSPSTASGWTPAGSPTARRPGAASPAAWASSS